MRQLSSCLYYWNKNIQENAAIKFVASSKNTALLENTLGHDIL